MIKLNNKQKKFLFDKHYITAKVLDALEEAGWQDFYINYYNFKLDPVLNHFYMNDLYLISKDDGEVVHKIYLNFQDDDYETLINLK